ncbi:MAG: lipoate protein ligase C-terminal domain-containing protein [Candidatus Heimdallarchaeota archaeon]
MKFARFKAEKGLIEIELTHTKETITELKITGDFFIYPEEKIELIEDTLRNSPIDKEIIFEKLKEVYEKEEITTPGIKLDDWVTVIFLAIDS